MTTNGCYLGLDINIVFCMVIDLKKNYDMNCVKWFKSSVRRGLSCGTDMTEEFDIYLSPYEKY